MLIWTGVALGLFTLDKVYNYSVADKKALIAEAFNLFSDYMGMDDVGYDWGSNFESGRYVIVVYQRFSAFENGKRMWINKAFQNKVGRF